MAASCRDRAPQRRRTCDAVHAAWRRHSDRRCRSRSAPARLLAQTRRAAGRRADRCPAPLQPGDAFGEEVTLPERTIIYLKGHSNWDAAFDTLVDAFKSLNEYLDKQGIKPTGPAMTIYTADRRHRFFDSRPPCRSPRRRRIRRKATSPSARRRPARRSNSSTAAPTTRWTSTYEAITNYLDDKQLEAKDVFIEEYVTDPVTTDCGQTGGQRVRSGEVMVR